MMLFNFKRTLTCVAILVPLMLAMPSVGHSQEPVAKTETVATIVSDETAKSTPHTEKGEPAAVASVAPKQADTEQLTASKSETTVAASKASVEPATEAPSNKKQDSVDDSDWHVSITPYIFLSGLTGKVGAQGRVFDLGSADFNGGKRDNFAIGFMAAIDVRKGRFLVSNDLIWANLTSEKETVGPFYSTTKAGAKIFIIDPELGYRLVNSEKGSVDVLAGVRIWSVEASLKATTGILPGFDVSQRKTWAAPVVGIRGVYNITPRFFIGGKFDIGGAGIGADLTTQLYGVAGYNFTKHFALLGGYRWLQVDYDDEAGFLFDTVMSGPMFGMKFSW